MRSAETACRAARRLDLFDDAWYSFCAGRSMSRREAVGALPGNRTARGPDPAPAVRARVVRRASWRSGEVRDPLVVYLRRRRFEIQTHPLFDTGGYLADHPDALEHPAGPVGHYLDSGASAGRASTTGTGRIPRRPAGRARGLAVGRRPALAGTAGPGSAELVTHTTDSQLRAAGAVDGGLTRSRRRSCWSRSAARSCCAARSESVLAQTSGDWELLVVTPRHGPDAAPGRTCLEDPRIRLLEGTHSNRWAAMDQGLAEATGRVRRLDGGGRHLGARPAEQRPAGAGRIGAVVAARLRDEPAPGRRAPALRTPDHGRTARGRRRDRAGHGRGRARRGRELGGFDESLRGGQLLDFMLRLTDRDDGAFLAPDRCHHQWAQEAPATRSSTVGRPSLRGLRPAPGRRRRRAQRPTGRLDGSVRHVP